MTVYFSILLLIVFGSSHCEGIISSAIVNNSLTCLLMDYKHSFLIGIQVDLLGHRMCICSALVDILKLFSKEFVPIYIPTKNA